MMFEANKPETLVFGLSEALKGPHAGGLLVLTQCGRAVRLAASLAPAFEAESGYRELYEALERLLCLTVTGWGYCVETAEELENYPEIDYPPIVAARAALAKVKRGEQ